MDSNHVDDNYRLLLQQTSERERRKLGKREKERERERERGREGLVGPIA